jgi:ABC-type polysaccharide/polyol phosphate transport system ATPase subunit
MSEPALSARNISVTFRRQGTSARLRRASAEPEAVYALRDVSFEVRRGEAFGIIGPNGAGKSTLMRVIGRTLEPDEGALDVRGATSTLLQLGVGFNPQLDGSRNIVLGLLAAGLSMREVDTIHDQIVDYSELGDAIYRPLATYSRGMQSRLAFAIATFNAADILLVDEVLAVGDEGFKQKSLATMRQLLENAGTIVMVSHSLSTVQEFCDRVMWLQNGTVRQIGEASAVVGAYRDEHTRPDVKMVRATRSDVDQTVRPLEVRRAEPLDVEVLRANRKDREAEPYVDPAPPHVDKLAPRRARSILKRGWVTAAGDKVDLGDPDTWPANTHAGTYRALMAWEPVATLLMANMRVPDPRWIETATQFAVAWSTAYPTVDSSDVWSGEATAMRATRLGALIDIAARDPLMTDRNVQELTVLGTHHAWALEAEDRFEINGIAGLQQIGAMVALTTRVPEIADGSLLEHTARRRLQMFLDANLTRDGTWNHHTPAFHAAAVESLTALLDANPTLDRLATSSRNRSERALAWFVMPDGSLPGFGAAKSFSASAWLEGAAQPARKRINRRWRTGPMRAAASAGSSGRIPAETTAVFPTGGYVVLRNRWPTEPGRPDAAYLAMIAGRHSTLGKHADDLSIVWFDRGRHLLVDSGGYVGDPNDAHHQYVTSARAHNTIEIDEADQFPGEPHGGGAVQAGSLDTLRFGAARARFGESLVIRRAVVLEPGRWLLVVDSMRDRNGPDAGHRYRQWFHLPSDLEVRTTNGDVHVTGPNVELQAVSLSGARAVAPIRGAVDPRQGWVTPAEGVIEPAWAFGWETDGSDENGFITLLSLAGAPQVSTADFDRRRAHVQFRVGNEQVALTIDLTGDLSVSRS